MVEYARTLLLISKLLMNLFELHMGKQTDGHDNQYLNQEGSEPEIQKLIRTDGHV